MVQQIDNKINQPPKSAPDFNKEVLEPLRASQEQQAAAEREQKAAEANAQVAASSEVRMTQPVAVSGSCGEWMAAAGIAPADQGYASYIFDNESGCRAQAMNPSGAYGVCQSLPAGKMASAGSDYMSNPVTQMRWCSNYAQERYGGWAGAYSAWLRQHWW